jgi:signal transduction histidine kinase
MQTSDLAPESLARLIESGRGLLAELDPELVLDRLLETARELTGARYAALGILDEQRRQLARFITRGVDEATHHAIGDLPRGRGILGLLIEDARPLRLHDIGEHPRSYGFPVGHPPMRSFLGVPVLVRGRAWGNLYLTEKDGGEDFDDEDELSVGVLADWAAIAIEHARLYTSVRERGDSLERALRGFEATAAIAQAVGAETDLDRVLELVVKRARALVDAGSVLILLSEGDEGGLTVSAVAGRAAEASPVGVAVPRSSLIDALAEGPPRRLASAAAELGVAPALLGVPDAGAALIVPLVYRGQAQGLLLAFDPPAGAEGFDDDDEHVLVAFAASAATAVATARTVAEARLRDVMAGSEAERRRWARELHDQTLQGLGALMVTLSAAMRADDPATLRDDVRVAVDRASDEIRDLRAIIADLRPAALDALGIVPALLTLVESTATLTGLEVDAALDLPKEGVERLDPDIETTVYRLVQEALSNVAKHAGARSVRISLREEDGTLHVAVSDDGVGIDPQRAGGGYGLVGMRERVALAGGRLSVAPGERGTVVSASLPAVRRADR